MNSEISDSPSTELAAAAENGLAGQGLTRRPISPGWLQRLLRKTADFVRQPKFWLACVVAVAVQVVLALAMTPAEDVSDVKKSTVPSAQPWQNTKEEPAARIVVPAAPVSVSEDHSDSAAPASTPMGPALPIDTTTDAIGRGGEPQAAEPQTVDRLDAPPVAARMAEKHVPAADGRRIAVEADGATLGGIAPFDPDVSLDKHEIR